MEGLKGKGWKLGLAAGGLLGAYLLHGRRFFQLTVENKPRREGGQTKLPRLFHLKVNHPRYQFAGQYEAGKAWCRQQRMEHCYISSVDGLTLHGSYLPAEDPVRIVLLCHGYKGSGFGDFAAVARFLHENGCDLLFIDQRSCGESQGRYITFGAMEQYDVAKWAAYLARRDPRGLPIYLYGESMGASAVLLASGRPLPEAVRGIVADCGFRSMDEQFRDMAKNWFHLRWIGPSLLLEKFWCRALAGFRTEDVDTAPAMEANRLPILFFHGLMDTYVPPQSSITNHNLCRAPSRLVLVKDARHLCSAYQAPRLYREALLTFFQSYDA